MPKITRRTQSLLEHYLERRARRESYAKWLLRRLKRETEPAGERGSR